MCVRNAPAFVKRKDPHHFHGMWSTYLHIGDHFSHDFSFFKWKKKSARTFFGYLKECCYFFFFFRGRGGKWFEPSTFQHSFGIIMKSLELYENYQNMTRKRKLIYEVGKFFPLIYSLGAATNQRNICEAQQNWFCWVYIFFYFIFQLRTYWCTYILGRV